MSTTYIYIYWYTIIYIYIHVLYAIYQTCHVGNEEVLQHLSWRLLSPTHQPLRESGSIDGQRLQKAILHCNRHWQSAVRFTSFYLVLKAGNFKTNGSYWFMMFLLDCQVIFENSPALDSQPAKGNLPIGSELRRLASLFLNLPVNGWLLRGSNLWFFWVWGCLGALGPGLIFGDWTSPTVSWGMPTWSEHGQCGLNESEGYACNCQVLPRICCTPAWKSMEIPYPVAQSLLIFPASGDSWDVVFSFGS